MHLNPTYTTEKFDLSAAKWLKDYQSGEVGIEQACRMLKCDVSTADKWIENGMLHSQCWIPKGGIRRFQKIDVQSIKRLQQERSTWLSVKDAAQRYDMTCDFVHELLRNKILEAVSGPKIEGLKKVSFRPDQVEKLFRSIFDVFYHHDHRTHCDKLICLKKAYRLIKQRKYSWSVFIGMILNAKIVPYAITSNPGLNCFLFDEQQVRNVKDRRPLEIDGSISVRTASRRLRMTCDAIQNLIRQGILKAFIPPGYKRLLTIPISSIYEFERTYTIAYHLARRLDMHIHRLNHRLQKMGIKPVFERRDTGRYITLYYKKDIDEVDLNELMQP
jgi:hypothetical protein